MSEKKSLFIRFKEMKTGKKVQIVIASVLTLLLMFSIPTYAWLNRQREIARLERIKSPDMLFITAADREDKININMDNIDVNAEWNTTPTATKATYKYFVFSVAGQYVTNYNLQLAHTKNNNYKYEIFEAIGTTTRPAGVEDMDYIAYDRTDNVPTDLGAITPALNSKYGTIQDHPTIYYQIKKENGEDVSLNNPPYDGHYLNLRSSSVTTEGEQTENPESVEPTTTTTISEFEQLAETSDIYHQKTYGYDLVEEHSEPLYWQVTKIPVGMVNNEKKPFYHEYILKVSWDGTANSVNLAKYKDTDIVYITVSVK